MKHHILLSLIKSSGIATNLSMSNLSTSAFKLTKPDFASSLDVSIPLTFFKSVFVGYLDKSTLTLMSPAKVSYGLGKY